jgi:hypothetical protein
MRPSSASINPTIRRAARQHLHAERGTSCSFRAWDEWRTRPSLGLSDLPGKSKTTRRAFCDFTRLDSILHCPSTAVPQRLFRAENRSGVRAGQYIDDLGAPLFARFVQLFFDVARDEGLPNTDDIVIARTWWFTIFGLAALFVIQGVVPGLSDQALVIEQTIATLWAGVKAVPRLPKSAMPKRSGRSGVSKR